MSRAFVREGDGAEDFEQPPEKLISPHANLVTVDGYTLLQAQVAHWQKSYAEAQSEADRAALARTARELSYWTQRLASAEVQTAPRPDGTVQFGSRVTIERSDGRQLTYRIVGEDEADPKHGTISHVSPLAIALMGKRVGDEAESPAGSVEIVAIA
jgi:transcription elongation GreA/GreB family factor